MDPVLERAIAERSELQLGLITASQLRSLEVSSRQRHRLIAGGRLVQIGMRTYRVGGTTLTFDARVLAACLDLGGVASHRTATHLHRLPIDPRLPVPIEVTVLKGRQEGTSPLAIVHTTTSLPADDLVHVGVVPVTSIARTILGLAALVPEIALDDLREVVDVAVQRRMASDEWLWWLLERRRCRGRNGVSSLESVMTDRAGRGKTESWLERAFLDLVEGGGFTLPKVQRRIRARGAFVARVDALWEPNTVVEVSGAATHTTRRQQSADAARRTRLGALGYRILEFTAEQVVHDREGVLATLAEAGIPRPPCQLGARRVVSE